MRPPAGVESAAYVVVSETLRHAPELALRAAWQDGRFVLELRGAAGCSTDLEDRVGAVGGTVTMSAGRLRMEVLCGS